MNRFSFGRIMIGAAVLAVVSSSASTTQSISTQDKYSLRVPDGLAFSEFKGYENVLRAILANPVMIKAFQEGAGANGRVFPDGSKMAKILWNAKKVSYYPWSAEKPDTMVDTLKAVELIEKDSKRFPAAHGWGYAEFGYDPASDTFKPNVTGTSCGATCHERAGAASDYLFNSYAKR
jgi:hypothetical protein